MTICRKVGPGFVKALYDTSPTNGLTHGYYRYPARFSPQFVREAIRTFSEPGDLVADPFMGGGTTLVEAIATDRQYVGTDINPLAVFVARVKSRLLSDREITKLHAWWEDSQPKMNLHRSPCRSQPWADEGYQKDLPWPIRKSLELVLSEVDSLPSKSSRDLARCAILKTTQWAVDGRKRIPSAIEFRQRLSADLEELISGNLELRNEVGKLEGKEKRALICTQERASNLPQILQDNGLTSARLIVTSPPYPGVHVLYHRWQVHGRRETPAPYWIIGSPDGKGGSFYTLGSRSKSGIDDYFTSVERIFSGLRSIIQDDGTMVQLISFSDKDTQLARYLEVMEAAGFVEAYLESGGPGEKKPLIRDVPNRKWHATLRGNTDSSVEHLLIHVPG